MKRPGDGAERDAAWGLGPSAGRRAETESVRLAVRNVASRRPVLQELMDAIGHYRNQEDARLGTREIYVKAALARVSRCPTRKALDTIRE